MVLYAVEGECAYTLNEVGMDHLCVYDILKVIICDVYVILYKLYEVKSIAFLINCNKITRGQCNNMAIWG